MAVKKRTAKPKPTNQTKKKELNEKGYMIYFVILTLISIILILGTLNKSPVIISTINFVYGKNSLLPLCITLFGVCQFLWMKTKNAKYKNLNIQYVCGLCILFVCGLYCGWEYAGIKEGIVIISDIFKQETLLESIGYIQKIGLINLVMYGLMSELVGYTYSMILFTTGIACIGVYLIGFDTLSNATTSLIANIREGFTVLTEKISSKLYEDKEVEGVEAQEGGDFDDYFNSEKETHSKKSSLFINLGASKQEVNEENELVEEKSDLMVNPKPSQAPTQTIKNTPVNHAEAKHNDLQQGSKESFSQNNKKYKLPDLKLLDKNIVSDNESINYDYAEKKGEQLIQVLQDFNVEAELICFHVGPAVTKFEIRPAAKIKVSKVLELQDNIKMELAVKDVRIEAPIPGKNTIGVEIPNKHISVVKMKELLVKERMKNSGQPKLSVILGKNLLGDTVYCDLTKMPHLLVAGATGSGKSVCMNTIIMSILYRATPDEVKLVLIDPKKVEFSNYTNLPHLISPVITDSAEAAKTLKIVVKIMDDRYNEFARAGAKNIRSYNEKIEKGMLDATHKKMPYIVVIIDELADLMLVAGKDVEGSIQRITQLARAAGIHLIVATQRPSTDVITGIIKANIPSRIAFAVSNGIDSKVILDRSGAEKLLGNGDMLYSPIGSNVMSRAQGVYVTDDEIERVVEFVTSQRKPQFDDTFINAKFDEEEENGTYNGKTSKDPMYDEVKAYVIETKKASTSLLQRKFGIGYNRAARLIDMLETNGIVGPANGSKPRDVYV